MIPKTAIDKAIEGGWNMGGIATAHTVKHQGDRIYFENGKSKNGTSKMYTSYSLSTIALDPTFWQALGKSLGWKYGNVCECGGSISDCIINSKRVIGYKYQCFGICGKFYEGINRHEWDMNAHRFYDLILTGGDTEKFWEEILK